MANTQKRKHHTHSRRAILAALLILLLSLTAVLSTACGGSDLPIEGIATDSELAPEEKAEATEANSILSITLNKKEDIRIAKGKAEIVEYMIDSAEEVDEKDLKAAIEDTEVVEVKEIKVKKRSLAYVASVTLTGLKNGETEIRLQNASGTVESEPLTVSVFEIATISFHESALELTVGETKTVSAELTYGGITAEDLSVKATDKNIDISDVDLQSKFDTTTLTFSVKARKTGVSAIEVKSLSSDVSDQLSVTVKEKPTEKPTEKPKEKPKETPKPKPAVPDNNNGGGSDANSSCNYILNTNTLKFHYPGCSAVNKMADYNKEEYYGTREEVIGKGYSPCGICNP